MANTHKVSLCKRQLGIAIVNSVAMEKEIVSLFLVLRSLIEGTP